MKIKNIIYSIFFSIFLSLSSNKIGSWNNLGINNNRRLYFDLESLIQPFMNIDILDYFLCFMLVVLILNYLYSHRIDYNKITLFFNYLCGFALALCMCYGSIVKNNETNFYFNSKIFTFIFVLMVVAWTIFFALAFKTMETFFNLQGKKRNLSSSITNWNFKWWKWFLIIFICWLPYIIILYPATVNFDTINQLNEFFNHGNWVRDDYPIAWYLLSKHPFTISNQHNFLVTLFYGFNFKIGLNIFHNTGIGLFISAFIQELGLVSIFTYALVTFERMKMSKKWVKCFGLFFALFPMLPILGMYLTKNILYSVFLLWSILLIANSINDSSLFNKINWYLLFSLSILGQLATEKYAIYIILIMIIIALLMYWKNSNVIKMISLAIIVVIAFSLGQHTLFSVLNVPNGDPIEGEAVMIQSTALYQKQFSHGMTKYQEKIINKVFVRKNLAKLYKPGLSDPVKSSGWKKIGMQANGKFNQHLNKNFIEGYRYRTVTRYDLKKYKYVWLQLMLRHPMVLFEAFMNQGYGYLDPQIKQGDISVAAPMNISTAFPSDSLNVAQVPHELMITNKKINIDYSNHMLKTRKIIALIYNVLSKTSPVSILFNGNWMIITSILCFLILISIGLLKEAFLILATLLQIPIFMLSPVNGSQRYMYPFFFAFGVIIGLTYCWINYIQQKNN